MTVSNLKEAIDWILKVTGKDGASGGSDAIPKLSEQVKNLLNEVENSGTQHSPEIAKVKDALGNGSLITKLAEGLQQFIGYETTSTNKSGRITGSGIAPSNIATHRLCDATIAFTIGVLESLSKDSFIKDKKDNRENVDSVVTKLSGCYGKGPKGFADVGEEVGKLQVQVTGTNTSAINKLVKAVKDNFESQLKVANENGNDIYKNVGQYLDAVFKAVSGKADVTSPLNTLFSRANPVYDATTLSAQIVDLKNGLDTQKASKGFAKNVLDSGKNAFMDALKMPNYTRMNYNAAGSIAWTSNTSQIQTCAKIFLGCLPLCYQALTYIYWCCHEKGGGCKDQTLGGGALRSYFDSQGLLPLYVESSRTGAHIGDSALGGFSEFATAASSPFTYANFTQKLQEKVTTDGRQLSDYCPLSALFYGASCYFRCDQIKNAKSAVGAPKTIREMLYFLAALQFSPQYGAFDGYVTEYFKAVTGNQSSEDHELKLQVADSGQKSGGNTLSAADLKSHLTSTFHLAPSLLGWLQGHSASISDEPWLHSLFSNSQFNLGIPSSGAGIFGALSNYTYALQFQLHFLYQQCNNSYTIGCGWNECSYGRKINESLTDTIVPSHICPTGCSTSGHDTGDHTKGGACEHRGCGTQGKFSPLQAFLTDSLPGFSRGHPSDPSSHLATCSGYLCHVPMGFKAENLRAASNGNTQGSHISLALGSFCGGFNTPLRQLSEKLKCLTKRTPRTLGDLFGFVWHLNGQLFTSQNETTVNASLKKFFESLGVSVPDWEEMSKLAPSTFWGHVQERIEQLMSQPTSAPTQSGIEKSLTVFSGLPFWYNLFMVKPDDSLPVRLFKLKSTDHNKAGKSNYQGHHDDLYSLYNPECKENEKTCGPYLSPLTHSAGATYAPDHASVYLSWLAYLTDDFHEWFQDMLDEFKNIDCTKSGCGGESKCSQSHANGTHGTTSNECKCDSVVQCGGTLPLLYRHGFRYYSPLVLKDGWYYNSNESKWKQENEYKRTCSHFASQLNNFLQPNSPLDNPLTSIDNFLYAIRWEFFSKLSGFWTTYICLILYTFFFLLDTLHLRSHLKLTSAHTAPPLALLTSGKPLPITKLTYLTQ
ncbi:variant erythrocyte surface antigen-1 family protein [Babesia caballi]|uniref:Variant erythrocyte surface antigen-1 family protein n=1 Tax=Babesia caballi TaxID=5871 RepID=A0AAV4LUM2_BABCB|nr:variant erythrocyte surface antigen-1 family protein [Babesia caballi]